MEEKPKRRRFQFSLRTLLVVVAAVAVPLGWWSWKAEKQRKAVEILKPNAVIWYWGEESHHVASEPSILHWRYKVRSISILRRITDREIAALQALDGLEEVRVAGTDVERVEAALPNCPVKINWR
ncbi:MAG: hypothetical protein K8T25_13420 [Planctomycetia bacterium]|nr:hypothetical protein [Planctomycetia bacterium]